jgi:hypothetical protein
VQPLEQATAAEPLTTMQTPARTETVKPKPPAPEQQTMTGIATNAVCEMRVRRRPWPESMTPQRPWMIMDHRVAVRELRVKRGVLIV